MSRKNGISCLFFFLILLILFPFSLQAQFTKTVELKPIQKQDWRYFYDSRKVKSPYALQIPLEALGDEEINRRYKNFYTLQILTTALAYAPLIYLLTTPVNSQADLETFLIMIGITIVVDLALDAVGHHQLKKAIDRYNILILPKKVGLEGMSGNNPPGIWGVSIVKKLPLTAR